MSLSGLLEEHKSHNRPFVVYRKPGSDQLCVLIQNDSTVHRIRDFSESGFIMAPFLNSEDTILIRPDQFLTIPQPLVSESRTDLDQTTAIKKYDKNKHLNLVSEAKEAIHSGDLMKVVLARQIVVELDKEPQLIFENLCLAHPDAFCYYWFHPEIGSWIGASPELLLSLKNNTLETYSLAGTLEVEEGVEPSWGEKELEEQQLVTDFIVDKLEQLSILPDVSPANQVQAGKLWHLKSVIKASATNKDLAKIIGALHPTPAVCGIPRDIATTFILGNEGLDRKFYTGFLGEINMGSASETSLYVNLRCMEYTAGCANIYVGGGITGLSDPEQEWQETEAKSQTILNAVFNYVK